MLSQWTEDLRWAAHSQPSEQLGSRSVLPSKGSRMPRQQSFAVLPFEISAAIRPKHIFLMVWRKNQTRFPGCPA